MAESVEVEGFYRVKDGGGDQTVISEDSDLIPLGPVQNVYAADTHYIVYTDPNDVLWYAADSTLDDIDPEFNLIWHEVQRVKALPMHNATRVKKKIFSSLASAVASGLEGDFKTAEKSLKQAEEILLEASEREAKTWFMPAAAGTGIVVSTIGLSFYLMLRDGNDAAPMTLDHVVAASIAGGGIGALLSAVGIQRRKPPFDPFADRKTAIMDGVFRIIYGIFTAFVVTLAVKIGLVTSAVFEDNGASELLLAAVAGGCLERWAVDIIRRVRPQSPSGTSPGAPTSTPPRAS